MLASKLTMLGMCRRIVTRRNPMISVVRGISDVQDPIVLTDDGSTFVAWHPPKPVPYELTLPMPKVEAKPPSVLKTDDCSPIMKPQKEYEMIDQLCKITYTTKHRWFPQGNRFKRKRENEKKLYHKEDRKYL